VKKQNLKIEKKRNKNFCLLGSGCNSPACTVTHRSQKAPPPPPPQDWQVFPKENPNLRKIEPSEHPQNTKEKMDLCFTYVKFGHSPTMRFYLF
jgi:hypothetical protein